MGLETGDYISNLNDQNPLDDDPTHEGDDHLRLIKNVLKMTFPGDGGGWTGPLTLDLDFLNGLDDTGIPGLITRTGADPNEIVSIGATTDDGTDVFTGGVNSFVQNWDDGGPQSATIMNATNVVDFIYPVGSILYQIDSVAGDPNVRFPGTTWDPVEGKFLMGSGTYNDGDEERTFTAQATGGKYSHKLTEAEMPTHRHRYGVDTTKDYGGDPYGATNGGGTDHQTEFTGGDQPHNNIPPYIVADIWYRTA